MKTALLQRFLAFIERRAVFTTLGIGVLGLLLLPNVPKPLQWGFLVVGLFLLVVPFLVPRHEMSSKHGRSVDIGQNVFHGDASINVDQRDITIAFTPDSRVELDGAPSTVRLGEGDYETTARLKVITKVARPALTIWAAGPSVRGMQVRAPIITGATTGRENGMPFWRISNPAGTYTVIVSHTTPERVQLQADFV